MSKYQVVMNLWPFQSDILLETDDINKAKEQARRLHDEDVEIWHWVSESDFEEIEY